MEHDDDRVEAQEQRDDHRDAMQGGRLERPPGFGSPVSVFARPR
jgi:hypothetical protein